MDTIAEMFNTQGRVNRAWYLWHIILDDVAMFTGVLVFVILSIITESLLFVLPGVGVLVAGGWAGVCITIKRLHDLNRPGWHWLLFVVPIYNFYLGAVLIFRKGTVGPNAFGADPLAGVKAIR